MEKLVFLPTKVILYWKQNWRKSFILYKVPLVDYRDRLVLSEYVARRMFDDLEALGVEDLLDLIKSYREEAYREAWPGVTHHRIRVFAFHFEFLPDSTLLSLIMKFIESGEPLWRSQISFNAVQNIWKDPRLSESLAYLWMSNLKFLLQGDFEKLQFQDNGFLLQFGFCPGGRYIDKAKLSLILTIPNLLEHIMQQYPEELKKVVGDQYKDFLTWVRRDNLCYCI